MIARFEHVDAAVSDGNAVAGTAHPVKFVFTISMIYSNITNVINIFIDINTSLKFLF